MLVYRRVLRHVDWSKIYPEHYPSDLQNKGGMVNESWDSYSNAGGYGIFCGKRCAARKESSCTPYKYGKNKGQLPIACQQAQIGAAGGGKSRTGIIVAASLIGVAALVGVVLIARRNK